MDPWRKPADIRASRSTVARDSDLYRALQLLVADPELPTCGGAPSAPGSSGVEVERAVVGGRCLAILRPAGSRPTAIEAEGSPAGAECLVCQVPAGSAGALRLTPPPSRCELAIIDRCLLVETGVAWLGRWRQPNPGLKVLLLWDIGEALTGELALALLRAQIAGVLAPDSPAEVYRKAIRAVLAGEIWLPRAVLEGALAIALQPLAEPGAAGGSGQAGVAARARLTPREAEVLALLQQGLSNKVIARRLDISPETVKKCLAVLYRKAGVSSRGHLIARMLG